MPRRKLSKQPSRQSLPAVDRETALTRTVQEFPDHPVSFILQLALTADEAPKWWSPARDRYLDKFWPTEPFLAGAIYSVASRNASFRWELTGPRDQVKWSQRLLCQADFGAGWQSFMMKVTQDLLCQGNGAFIEVIRPAKAKINGKSYDAVRAQHPDSEEYIWYAYDRSTGEVYNQYDYGFKVQDSVFSLPIGIAHLDSARCTRTGDPDYPVVYTDLKGGQHKMGFHQVLSLAEMPSPREEWKGVQVCLSRDSMVAMADGSLQRIVDLVRSKSTEQVLSLNARGHMVKRRITNWYEVPLGNRSWVNVRGRTVQVIRGPKRRNSWVTDDHPILTPSGWKTAGDLRTGDEVVTSCPTPNLLQRVLLAGTLLGDASIVKRHYRPRISMAHHVKNADWFEIKASVLSAYGWKVRRRKSMVIGETRHHAGLFGIWADFHREGQKKTLPLDLVQEYLEDDHLRAILLTAWYLDDGSIRNRVPDHKNRRPKACIAAPSFAPEKVERIAEILNQLGYKVSAVHLDRKNHEDWRVLLFSTEGSAKFFDEIAPYVPPSMRYKLPIGAADFEPSLWDFGPPDVFIDEVVVKQRDHRGRPHLTNSYCIDVEETHNFVTANLVVHNCAVDRVLKLSQILRDLSTYKSEKVSGRFARAIHLTNIDPGAIQDAVNQAHESADSRGLLRYMQPIVAATLDPNARPEVATLELASLPSGFDEETTMRWYIAGLATVLGVDYGFLAPLPGSKLGTAAQAETQERQARGKSSRLFMRMLAHKFNYSGVLPRTVVFKFAQTDPYEESERDRAFARRTRARSTAISSGEITPDIARQLAADVGDLDPKYLAMMGEADISPIITVDGETMIMEPGELLPRHLVPVPPTQSGQPEEREE